MIARSYRGVVKEIPLFASQRTGGDEHEIRRAAVAMGGRR